MTIYVVMMMMIETTSYHHYQHYDGDNMMMAAAPPIHASVVERGGSYWTSRLGSQALLGANLGLLTF